MSRIQKRRIDKPGSSDYACPGAVQEASLVAGTPMSSRMRYLLCLILALSGPGSDAIAEDWPHWTGPSGRNVADEWGLPDSFDRKTQRNIKWVTPLGDVVFGAPTISRTRVFVGTNMAAVRDDQCFRRLRGGVLACLDEATGERLWNLVSPERTQGLPANAFMEEQRWGICSSPTVDGQRVYVITNGDDLLCLDVNGLRDGNDGPFQDEAQYMAGEGNRAVELIDTDADIIWRYDIPRELGVAPHDVGSCSVLVYGDVVYTSTSNRIGRYDKIESVSNAVNPDAPAFIALNKYTGTLLATDDTKISKTLFHAQWGSPSLGRVGERDLILLGGSDGFCYAFEALGKKTGDNISSFVESLKTVWSFDCNPPHYKQAADGTRIEYSWGDHRDYKRRAKLVRDIEDAYKNGTVSEEKVIQFHASIEKYNASAGTFIGPSEILTSPVFYEDYVYVVTGRDPLHGLGRGVLNCLDATQEGDIMNSGKAWSFEGIGRSLSTPAFADGLVYAADIAGMVYCLDAQTGELVWQQDTGHEIWGNPLVADGKIYLNARQSFWIFKAGRKKEVLFTSRGGGESGPVAANGAVYAFIRGSLYAIGK